MKPRIMQACLYAAGVAALLTAPFLTWFDYGPFSTLFPSQVSLVWLLESGYWLTPVLYLLGVAAAVLPTGMIRRPFTFVRALPAAFPVFILAATLDTFFDGSMAYAQAVTVGTFTALLGSALLESSYFASRRDFKPLRQNRWCEMRVGGPRRPGFGTVPSRMAGFA